ncbi:MAG: type IV secretory system conjugative DNA transfer family protein [Candidatus Micrarchaeaceae archaeon]
MSEASKTVASGLVSGMLFSRQSQLPKAKELLESARPGIYIGESRDLHMPVFLDFEALVNPHAFVCGMTGSGKTYLMKNLMLKLRSALPAEIYCIDFTGEYSEFAASVGARHMLISGGGSPATEAVKALDSIAARMRAKGTRRDRTPCAFVFLDESWKLLSSSDSFMALLREGRKYGVGLFMASQLIEDIAAPMLDNIATIFAFRLQNRQSIDMLGRNYGLGESQLAEIQSLGVGQAMLLQVHRSGAAKAFAVNVHGVSLKRYLRLLIGGKMYIEISSERLEEILANLCGDRAQAIVAEISNNSISLSSLIRALSTAGASGDKIVCALRDIGVKDKDIADAFARINAR